MFRALRFMGRIAVTWFALEGAAHAGSLDVQPVRLDLSPRQRVAALTVRNAGGQPIVIQLQPQAWSQPGNTDVLTPTDALIATPPLFTLAPGARQLVRIGQRATPVTDVEATYRLILKEVPPPPDPTSKGLRMALRMVLPVFVAPTSPAAPRLTWHVGRVKNQLAVTATNDGNTHAHLTGLTVASSALPKPLGIGDVATYILPHASHTWLIDAAVPTGAPLRVAGHDDANAVQADLVAP